ncbi:MAG: hypothetical protein ACR2RB_09565 [Gammaproteobacteria bacterium]
MRYHAYRMRPSGQCDYLGCLGDTERWQALKLARERWPDYDAERIGTSHLPTLYVKAETDPFVQSLLARGNWNA